MKRKKVVARVGALMMAVVMGGTLVAHGQEVTWTNDSEAEITILFGADAAVDSDNIVYQEIEKLTNTNIEVVTVPYNDLGTKRNALITAGQVPDIFSLSLAEAETMKENGQLADLTDVLTAVYPEIFEEYGEELAQVPINNDGIYMIPNFSADYPTGLTIRTDWLENLGLEMPTDLESFAEVMHAFTYDDPDGNGVDDTYGLNAGLVSGYGNFNSILGAYGISLYYHCMPMELEDGTITTQQKHPNFLEAVTYIKGLFDDGVISPDYMSIPAMSMWEYLWTGKAGAIDFNVSGVTGNWIGRFTEDPKPEFDSTIIVGPYGDSGVPATYPSLSQGYVVSADCQNLEGIANIIKLFQSLEGNHLLNLGVEGVMFQWIDKEAGTYERLGDYTDDAIHRQHGGHILYTMLTGHEVSEASVLPEKAREIHQESIENAIDWPYIIKSSEVYKEYGGDMDQILSEMWVELLQADYDDLQSIYDQYMADWEAAGGSDWEAEMTQLWKEQNQ